MAGRHDATALGTQEAIVRFLKEPDSYPHPVDGIEVHETHGSWVFLAGRRAYKLKKAIDLGFFDYSTLKKRRHYCEEEVRLNRRLAPDTYLGVRSIREVRDPQDRLELVLAEPGDERGREVDCVVEMERLSEDVRLDDLLEKDAITSSHLERLVGVLADFYRQAARSRDIDRFGEPERIRGNVLENFQQTEELVGEMLDVLRFHAIRSAQLSFLSLRVDLLARRIAEGWIRDGHGDLRAEHVAFVPEPVVIDCIEFADRFRYGDIAADLAFLVMDLEFLGHAEHAATLSDLYERVSGDREFSAVIDFYASYRAYVRAKVDAMKLVQGGVNAPDRDELERRVRRHFELAHFHTLNFHDPLCILVGGLSGTGKSTLAKALSRELGAPLVRSDEVRKELVGVAPTERSRASFEGGIYSPAVTRATYRTMEERTRTFLTAGASVVVDATFSSGKHRQSFLAAARESGASLVHFECRVPLEIAARRMERRARESRDASDAGPDIQLAQEAAYDPAANAVVLETTAPPEAVLRAALEHLRRASE